jgi:hypothetical protein
MYLLNYCNLMAHAAIEHTPLTYSNALFCDWYDDVLVRRALLQASALQSDTLSVKFELKGDLPADGVSPHQSLLRLQHSDSGLESFHLAKRTGKGSSSSSSSSSGGSSKLAVAVELKREAAGMLHRSGEWSVDLLVMPNCLHLNVRHFDLCALLSLKLEVCAAECGAWMCRDAAVWRCSVALHCDNILSHLACSHSSQLITRLFDVLICATLTDR